MRRPIFLTAVFLVLCNQILVADERFDPTSHISKEPVTQTELQIIRHGDYRSIGRVLGRLEVLHKAGGAEAVRAAIPDLNALLSRLQAGGKTDSPEGDLVNFLGHIGDASSKQVLLNSIKRNRGNPDIGLIRMDASVVDSVITYLNLPTIAGRGLASHTLRKMYRSNPDMFTVSHVSLIRQKLIESLSRYAYKGSQCIALSVFGDRTTIPILTTIATTDTLTTLRGKFPNRRYAQYAIDKIQAREE